MTIKSRKILRSHSGCWQCRRRGKKCDETKPCCQACTRLSLECSYRVEYSFRNLDRASFLQQDAARIPPTPGCRHNHLEANYFNHFQTHARHLVPSASVQLADGSPPCPALRFAVLCISASNLSMLDTRVQTRIVADGMRPSVFSPLVNNLHHTQAQRYHDQALRYCRAAVADDVQHHAPALLTAYTLLAYYHHASTDHSRFGQAVWESVRFVFQNTEEIRSSTDGAESLQMWYRLCMSHRLAKPPALLLEGEGASSFGPNRFPDAVDHLYLKCILGMSTDDLIYDILIKSMEIRTRLVVFRCVGKCYDISEQSDEIGSVTHEVLNRMLGRHNNPDECAEARKGFVRGSHLLALLDVQKERLKVWRSRLRDDQQPAKATFMQQEMATSIRVAFRTHRDSMNALYCILCEMIFEEAHEVPTNTRIDDLAHTMCHIISAMDFTTSNTSDVYTFSLAETLLQLVFLWRSDTIFHYILDIIWPRLETQGRGYEHSHYPTHLVKRIITQMAVAWSQDRVINFALPAVTESISKLKLLDIHHPLDLVVGGYDRSGRYFLERLPLP